MISADNPYTMLQRCQYECEAQAWSPEPGRRDLVVGSFDAHNAWEDYELLWAHSGDTTTLRALDLGCGPGRSIVRWWDHFARIDGVDIAPTNLRNARSYIASVGHDPDAVTLYESNGVDLANVPSDTYDLVFSTITLQHICVYAIRKQLIAEAIRVLKPGCWLSVQMGYGKHPTAVGYYHEEWTARLTNSGCDTRVDNPRQLADDCEAAGCDEFRHIIRPTGPGDAHAAWIFWAARKAAA